MPLSPKPPLLHRPQPQIRNKGKSKRQREPNITTIRWITDVFPNRPNEPHLRHTHDGAHDAKAEGDDGCDARWEEMRGGIVGNVVAFDALFEEEMFRDGDTFVYREPVALIIVY